MEINDPVTETLDCMAETSLPSVVSAGATSDGRGDADPVPASGVEERTSLPADGPEGTDTFCSASPNCPPASVCPALLRCAALRSICNLKARCRASLAVSAHSSCGAAASLSVSPASARDSASAGPGSTTARTSISVDAAPRGSSAARSPSDVVASARGSARAWFTRNVTAAPGCSSLARSSCDVDVTLCLLTGASEAATRGRASASKGRVSPPMLGPLCLPVAPAPSHTSPATAVSSD
mmetsp:Transcript_74078/g.205825  ORF Transcript_74078/g.205825 Transcript_74078/m.205825 type:complete len:239 (-) Transcript_74078:365-1081(-)